MTMGDLICTGVDVSFPDDTLSLGDFPPTIKAVVKLKPAKSRDRVGIEILKFPSDFQTDPIKHLFMMIRFPFQYRKRTIELLHKK